MFKNILLAILSAIGPLIWTELTDSFPDFPLAQSAFIETLIWFVGLLVGGWNLAKATVKYRFKSLSPAKFDSYLEK